MKNLLSIYQLICYRLLSFIASLLNILSHRRHIGFVSFIDKIINPSFKYSNVETLDNLGSAAAINADGVVVNLK